MGKNVLIGRIGQSVPEGFVVAKTSNPFDEIRQIRTAKDGMYPMFKIMGDHNVRRFRNQGRFRSRNLPITKSIVPASPHR